VFADITTADGPGFPSGHTFGSTLVWGGFALIVGEGKRSRAWLAFAGAVVGIVSLSRLVLGVHYLVDVVVGVGLGLVVLGALYVVADRGTVPGRVLLVSVGVGVLGLLGASFESVAALGSAVGAWLVWRGVADSTPAHPSNRREVGAGSVILGLAGGFFALLYVIEPPLLVAFFGSAIAVGSTVAARWPVKLGGEYGA